jgi:YbgC/YbaW family acyl-CoA thioester hydrolase
MRGPLFNTNYKIAFSETDPGGIVFFAEFFKIAHITYERFFDSLDLDRNYFLDDKFILPIVHSSADYISPVKFGDELNCELTVGSIGNTSFELKYTLYNKSNIAAKIITKHVVVAKDEFKKTSIPDDLLNALTENQH